MKICAISVIRCVGGELPQVMTVGFYKTLNVAQEAVMHNRGDIAGSGYHQFAVIEVVAEGLYSPYFSRYFYKYDTNTGMFYPCDKEPDFAKNVVNFWS